MIRRFFCVLFLAAVALPTFAQFVPRVPLFEHFTQASCGPCAQQNPVFQGNILKKYRPLINHVAYHTSWPGVDPMNDHNPTEVAARVSYYKVHGVPHMVLDGNVWEGGPAGVSESLVQAEIAQGAPIAISVDLDRTQQPWQATVTITSVAEVPDGDYRLFVAAVEEHITYATPPGSNGEKEFPNVFRRFLSKVSGDTITLPAVGESRTWTYTVEPHTAWDFDSVYVLAFVQEYQTRTVLNSGSSLFRPLLVISKSPGISEVAAGSAADLQFEIHTGTVAVCAISVTATAPEGWSVQASVAGTEIDGSDTLQIDPTVSNGVVTVQTGNQPGYAIVSIVVDPIDPDLAPTALNYLVFVGSEVLLLHSSQAFGDGKDYYQELRSAVEQRMQSAGIEYMAVPVQEFLMARKAQLLNQVRTVFYATGWTFPSLPAALVVQLQRILDAGGNLFIAGQDIGWDTWDQSGFGTSTSRAFYRDYLHARYLDDGTAARGMISPVETDPIFGSVFPTSIYAFYPGNLYPDAIEPADSFGHLAFTYPGGTGAGIWAQKAQYKVVYLGIGIEQLQDLDVAASVLSLAKQWFDGQISGVAFQSALQSLLMVGSTVHLHFAQPISGVVEVFDALGRKVRRVPLEQTRHCWLRFDGSVPGVYAYRLVRNDGTVVQHGTLLVR